MEVKIIPFAASGTITAPPSKSEAQRMIICAALAKGSSFIGNIGNSGDVKETTACVKSFGADVKITSDGVNITGVAKPPEKIELHVDKCGFAARVCLPAALALSSEVKFTVGDELKKRPLRPLIDCLTANGVETDGEIYRGRLKSGVYTIDGNVSSQFISGLLIATAYADGVSDIIVKGERVSENYVDMTVDVMKLFGANAEKTSGGYRVSGGYKPIKQIAVSGDYSSAAYFLSLGALTGDITVKGLRKEDKQPDRAIIDILKKYGAKVEQGENHVLAKNGEKRAIEFSCKEAPDLAPIVAVIAAYAKGKSVIRHTARLKDKESDREQGIIDMLKAAGVEAEKGTDEITIYGGKPKGGRFSLPRDHRLIMAASVLASAADGESVIENAESVAKSYPDFFKELKNVGLQG